MSQPAITIIGHVCIDHNSINDVKVKTWGSPAMYMAKYYLKHFGIKANIIASYGRDFLRYTAGLTLTEEPGDQKTLVYENIVNNGQRIQYCHNSQNSLPVPLRPDLADLIRKTDILIIAPQIANFSERYIAEVIQLANKDCVKVLLPQGYMRQIDQEYKIIQRDFSEQESILPYFDAVVASEEDYDGILDQARTWSGYKENSSIVITQAEQGAALFQNGESQQVPTTPISFNDIKNPVGSGDIFGAQFTIDLFNNLSPYDAARNANLATSEALLSEPKAA